MPSLQDRPPLTDLQAGRPLSLSLEHHLSEPPPQRKNVPAFRPRLPIGGDFRARKEQASFERGDLEQVARANEFSRSEATKGFFHTAVMVVGYAILVAFIAIFCTWVWHMICPHGLEFVPQEKMDKLERLKDMALSSAVGALIIRYITKQLG